MSIAPQSTVIQIIPLRTLPGQERSRSIAVLLLHMKWGPGRLTTLLEHSSVGVTFASVIKDFGLLLLGKCCY